MRFKVYLDAEEKNWLDLDWPIVPRVGEFLGHAESGAITNYEVTRVHYLFESDSSAPQIILDAKFVERNDLNR